MARHHTNGDAGNAGNAGNAGDAGGAWSFRERSKRSLRRGGRAVHDYLASWRGTVRDGATWHRLRSKWPPSWSQVAVAVAVVAVAAVVGWETCGLRGCPGVERLTAFQPGGAPILLDRSGEELARLAPFTRELVELESLPDYVPAAFIAVEDRRFRDHGAVDWRRFLGSLFANVRAGGIEQGGSTITMQLARSIFPDRVPGQERTVARKLLEVRVAGEIEDRFTKDEILELYLNHIYFGGAVHGLEAAAREYFGVPATGLTLAQAATLAAMPKAPNLYHPREHPERARGRRDLVLSLMAAQGRIDPDAADRARAGPVATVRERRRTDRRPPPAPYFVHAARRVLEERLGDGLYSQPYRIHTTLDRTAQTAAERALEAQLSAIEAGAYGRYLGGTRYGAPDGVDERGTRYLQGAVVVLSADSGDVLALVGGRDFTDSRFDRALRSRRPVGSAFKPFVYAAALEDGYAPSQHLSDEPLTLELEGGEVWEPRNFETGYGGEVTFRDAVVRSNNVAAVRLALAVGTDEVAKTAREAGVRSRLHRRPSLALGTVGLSLLELTAAYTPFATLGDAVEPRLVTAVEDTSGEVVWRSAVERRKALEPGVAYLVTDLLRDAVDRGTARAVRQAGFRGPAAGKTGTTNDGRDAWFVGFTPTLVGGVWIGLDRPGPIVARGSGGRLAAPVWGRAMRRLDAGAANDWRRPEAVVERPIDPASGLVLAEGCRPETGSPATEIFLASDLPAETCPAGERAEPGFFRRIARGAGDLGRRVVAFVAGLFEGDRDEADREGDRYLGRPRLPRAAETRRVAEPDTAPTEREEPLGVPLDSLPGWGDVPPARQPGPEPGDSAPVDTLPR